MFWFLNDRSGRCKLIEIIEHIINRLAYNNKQSVYDFVVSSQICDLWKLHTLQTLSFMNDILNNCVYMPFSFLSQIMLFTITSVGLILICILKMSLL